MKDINFFAVACIIGGFCRIIASFIDYEHTPEIIEVFYMLIDLGLLLGLLGLYILHRSTLSIYGKFGIVTAFCGFAVISGPETTLYNIGIYQIGSPVIGIGVTFMATDLIVRNIGSTWPPLLLLTSVIMGFVSIVLSQQGLFILTGIFFGLGFILLGTQMRHELKLRSVKISG